MNYDRKRWIVLASSCLINLCIGSTYAWSVFSSPMSTLLGGSDLSLAFTFVTSLGPITMIPGGHINDRFGPKYVVLAGGLLFSAGLLLSGFSVSPLMLIFSYGVCCGLGVGMVYGCTIGCAVKFFPDRRGFAGGITTASYGISSVLMPPIAHALISQVGILASFRIIGFFFSAVISISACFLVRCPDGYAPAGWTAATAVSPSHDKMNQSWRQMLATPIFYIMLLMLTCGAVSGLMVTSQASLISQTVAGFSSTSAAAVVSLLAMFNTVGRICAGTLSDWFGRINTLITAMLAALVGLSLLFAANPLHFWKLLVGMALIGLCFGTFMGTFPGFTADQFGSKNNTTNYGIMFIGFSAGGFLGPILISRIYTTFGNYKIAFLLSALLVICGLCLSLLYRRLQIHCK